MTTSTQTLVIGTRVCASFTTAAAASCMRSMASSVPTPCGPSWGAGVSGGAAHVDVVFANGHQTRAVPEVRRARHPVADLG